MNFIEKTYAALTALTGRLNALKTAVDDLAAAPSGGGELSVTTAPFYEYREIWAEESGGMGPGAEWSYGNGATGYMGLPHDGKDGWEVIAMYFNADTYTAGTTGSIDFMLYKTAGNASANVLASIDISGLEAGHASKYHDIAPPLLIEASTAPLGFYTRALSGSASDVRVGVRMRRKIGDYVTSVGQNAGVVSNKILSNGWDIEAR